MRRIKTRKLSMTKETLRSLTSAELAHAAGGDASGASAVCPRTRECTTVFSCVYGCRPPAPKSSACDTLSCEGTVCVSTIY